MDIKKIAQFALGPIAGAAISFISLPIVAWLFLPEDVGRLSMFYLVINCTTMIFVLGTDQSFVRLFHERQDKQALFYATFIPSLFVLLIALIGFFLFYRTWAEDVFDFTSPILIFGISAAILFSFVIRYLSLILRMEEKGTIFSMAQIIPKVIFLIGLVAVVLLLETYSFDSLLLAQCLGLFTALAFLFVKTKQFLLNKSLPLFVLADVQASFRYGFPLVFGSVAFWGLTATDKLALRSWSGLDELAVYSVAVSFAGVAVILQSIFSTVWAPIIYKMAAEGNAEENIDDIVDSVVLVVIAFFALSGIFSPLVAYVLPEQYAAVPYILVCCLANPLFYTLSETTGVGIAIKKKSQYSLVASLIAFVCNLLGNYLLVPILGAKGAAISTAISFLVFLICRTELSCLLWKPVKRLKMYALLCYAIALSVGFILYGSNNNLLFLGLWLSLLFFAFYSYRQKSIQLITAVLNLIKNGSLKQKQADNSRA